MSNSLLNYSAFVCNMVLDYVRIKFGLGVCPGPYLKLSSVGVHIEQGIVGISVTIVVYTNVTRDTCKQMIIIFIIYVEKKKNPVSRFSRFAIP